MSTEIRGVRAERLNREFAAARFVVAAEERLDWRSHPVARWRVAVAAILRFVADEIMEARR